jgi:hypothetical protein
LPFARRQIGLANRQTKPKKIEVSTIKKEKKKPKFSKASVSVPVSLFSCKRDNKEGN